MSNTEQTAVMMIEVGMTQQPESYTNVRRNITLPVFVKPGDDVTTIAKSKMTEAVKIVEDSIDDDFERGHKKAAIYSNEPRYDYVTWSEKKLLAIIPANLTDDELPNGWNNRSIHHSNHRLKFLKQELKKNKEYKNYEILDCTQNFDEILALPKIEKGTIIYHQKHNIAILTPKNLPPSAEFMDQYDRHNWGREFITNYYEDIIKLAEGIAKRREVTLYICWDGDLSQVPPPITQPEPEPDKDEDDDDDDDETAEDLF